MNTERQSCWRCGRPRDAGAPALVCAACEAPQPLDGSDLFTVLGLPRALTVDPADLERRYLAASRVAHPDRHQTADARAQQLSVAASAALNRAYRTLRDPVALGRYWLELHGERLGDDNRVPPALATLVFETQELLETLRDAGPGDADRVRAEVADVRASLDARVDEQVAGLRAAFAAAPAGPPLADLRRRLAEIAYLRTLRGDVDAALGEPGGTHGRH